MKRGLWHFIMFFFFAFFLSCTGNLQNSYKAKPRALGKMNEIVIIADDDLWQSEVMDSVDYYFGGPYPIIPRPEPIFDLRHFNAEELVNESLRRQLRTYLFIANIRDDSSKTTQMVVKDLGTERIENAIINRNANISVGKDKWATGQILVYLIGNSVEEIAGSIQKNFNSIAKRINEHDRAQLEATTFAKGQNLGLSEILKDKFGIELKIPLGYAIATENEQDNFIWMRNELKDGTMSLVFKKLKYTNSDQLTKEFAKRTRDIYGRKYISSPEKGSYMSTNDVDLPMFEYIIDINGHYAKEYRGIWEMENDFMGGPFVSYLVVNEERGELLFADAFVYLPGKSKRNYMQQLDFLVKQIKW